MMTVPASLIMFWLNTMLVLVSVFAVLVPPATAADGTVCGQITVGDEPLVEGRILFHFCDNQFVGTTVTDGRFTVNRVPVGVLKVTFEGGDVPQKFSSGESTPFCIQVRQCVNTFNFSLPSDRPKLAPGEIAEFFDGDTFDHDRWTISESTDQTQFRVQDESLITSVDASFQGVAICMTHLKELTGNFEVRCDLELLEAPDFDKAWINLELVLLGADGQFHSMMGLDKNGGSRFSALYMPSRNASKNQRKYTFVSVPQTSKTATLCLRRIGAEIIVGTIQDGAFVETKRLACDTTRMRLRTQCFMRESMPGPTSFRFDNLRIRPLSPTPAE